MNGLTDNRQLLSRALLEPTLRRAVLLRQRTGEEHCDPRAGGRIPARPAARLAEHPVPRTYQEVKRAGRFVHRVKSVVYWGAN